ncbi:hypothetical protein [Nesterenkonia ebinurensis]|uniref:hypothetical protein n=1 Tax=Nesterenkonia ebinurensis TaxID=2608252 RepID=UPI00123D43F9|nr:hypothetical protein [Nesterenkonia ebinurensis]
MQRENIDAGGGAWISAMRLGEGRVELVVCGYLFALIFVESYFKVHEWDVAPTVIFTAAILPVVVGLLLLLRRSRGLRPRHYFLAMLLTGLWYALFIPEPLFSDWGALASFWWWAEGSLGPSLVYAGASALPLFAVGLWLLLAQRRAAGVMAKGRE